MRVFDHFNRLLAIHGRNHETFVEGAQRGELVDLVGFFPTAVGLTQHLIDDLPVDVTYRFRAAVPANRHLLCQRVSHDALVAGSQ